MSGEAEPPNVLELKQYTTKHWRMNHERTDKMTEISSEPGIISIVLCDQKETSLTLGDTKNLISALQSAVEFAETDQGKGKTL